MSEVPVPPESVQAAGEVMENKLKPTSKASKTADDTGSLEGLLTTLKQQIKDSNWLEKNTAERWEQENPDLAREFKKSQEGNSESSSTSSS